MKIKSSSLIAREIALIYSEAAFEPRMFEHVPGITNTIADALSRLHEPMSGYVLPPQLASIKETSVPVRRRGWYSSLTTV